MPNKGRLIVSISGYKLTEEEREMLAHPMLAGIILFAKNYVNHDQLKSLIGEIQSIADLPVFADQEGGLVQRFQEGFTLLPRAKNYGEAYDIDPVAGLQFAEECGAIMAKELSNFGIISLAPVCDLDAGNAAISQYGRSFHAKPSVCLALLRAFIKGMGKHNMPAIGKHFPGHGQNNGDTHHSIVVDDRDLEMIEANDLVPFIELIKENQLAAIMPAHIIYTKVDPENTAGASAQWLHDILRVKYGFKGIVVSDCLSMPGAGDGSLLDKTIQALFYGGVAMICHRSVKELIPILNSLLKESEIYALDPIMQQQWENWVGSSSKIRKSLGESYGAPIQSDNKFLENHKFTKSYKLTMY